VLGWGDVSEHSALWASAVNRTVDRDDVVRDQGQGVADLAVELGRVQDLEDVGCVTRGAFQHSADGTVSVAIICVQTVGWT
jgi:hypothetical protein